jgi:hypothetical protein
VNRAVWRSTSGVDRGGHDRQALGDNLLKFFPIGLFEVCYREGVVGHQIGSGVSGADGQRSQLFLCCSGG